MEKNKNNIDEVLKDFDEKFCPNDIWDTKLITFELKDWLKQKLHSVEQKSYEKGFTEGSELTGRIAEETQGKKFEDNFENGETLSDDAFITETEFGKCIKETLNLKSLKTKK